MRRRRGRRRRRKRARAADLIHAGLRRPGSFRTQELAQRREVGDKCVGRALEEMIAATCQRIRGR